MKKSPTYLSAGAPAPSQASELLIGRSYLASFSAASHPPQPGRNPPHLFFNTRPQPIGVWHHLAVFPCTPVNPATRPGIGQSSAPQFQADQNRAPNSSPTSSHLYQSSGPIPERHSQLAITHQGPHHIGLSSPYIGACPPRLGVPLPHSWCRPGYPATVIAALLPACAFYHCLLLHHTHIGKHPQARWQDVTTPDTSSCRLISPH